MPVKACPGRDPGAASRNHSGSRHPGLRSEVAGNDHAFCCELRLQATENSLNTFQFSIHMFLPLAKGGQEGFSSMASTQRKRNSRRTKLSWTDLICTGPGTLAGKYMRMFWHPVYRAEDLPTGKAKPIRIMGEDFTLYRGTGGTPHMVAFRCAHRGTQLSAGWVEGDCIRCMYHGWLYDSTGQCLEQPAEQESFAKKIRIRSCPTEEYLGLIFAYLGEGKAPPLPRYPHFEKEGVLEVLPVQVWPCNFFQRVDNNG